jgi:hypothetical protein
MKTKLLTAICVLALSLGGVTTSFASEAPDPLAIIADTVVVRPACLVATAIGTVFFVVSLPFAAVSRSVKQTAHTLVIHPAKATFTRPLGEMEGLED